MREIWNDLTTMDGSLGLRTDGTVWVAAEADECTDPKGAAALCLHGQPFGFTWEDVDRLREFARDDEANDRVGDQCFGQEFQRWARELADRIAALLPPRE